MRTFQTPVESGKDSQSTQGHPPEAEVEAEVVNRVSGGAKAS